MLVTQLRWRDSHANSVFSYSLLLNVTYSRLLMSPGTLNTVPSGAGAFAIWNRLSGVHGGHNCHVAFV